MTKVEAWFEEKGAHVTPIYPKESSATVELAAKALGILPEQVAKSLAFRLKDRDIVLLVCGTARVDNKKFKETFGCKAKMLSAEETLAVTGHPVGGVCPFALPDGVGVCLDESLRRFDIVYPAAGTPNSGVPMTPQLIAELTEAQWVDVAAQRLED